MVPSSPSTRQSIQPSPNPSIRTSIRPRTLCRASVGACSAPVVYGAVQPKSCARPVARDLGSPRTALPNRCVSAPAPGRTAGFQPWRQGEQLFPPRGRRRPGDLACLPRTAWANCWFSALAPGRTAVSAHRVPSARGTWPVRGPLRLSSGAWANRWFSALPPGRTAPGAYPSRVGKPAFRGLGLLTDHVADLLFLAPDALRSCCFCPGRTERMPGDFT